MISLVEAKATGCCRICGGRIVEPGSSPPGYPVDWMNSFRKMVFPVNVVLNYGEEFAHSDCLNKTKE